MVIKGGRVVEEGRHIDLLKVRHDEKDTEIVEYGH